MRVTVVWCAIALFVGCGGSTSVRPFGGAYALASVDGRPDPQPFLPPLASPELLSGALHVGADTLGVSLSLQPVDSRGRVTGDVIPWVAQLPYARLGDSLFLPSDTAALHDPLYRGPPPTPIGLILGSSVRLTLALALPNSVGFNVPTVRQFLFVPAQ